VVEENNEKERYTLAYIQQQERHIMDALREKFNLQIQMNNLAETAEQFKRMYNESQNEVAKQNELLRQATTSIEKLTKDLKICENVSEDRMKLISQLNQATIDFDNLKTVHSSAQKEIERLNNELNEMYTAQSKSVDVINETAVKKSKPKKVIEDDTF
jgi:uncharacterized phage infection (PIP) family protein YhgE